MSEAKGGDHRVDDRTLRAQVRLSARRERAEPFRRDGGGSQKLWVLQQGGLDGARNARHQHLGDTGRHGGSFIELNGSIQQAVHHDRVRCLNTSQRCAVPAVVS